MSTRCVIEEIEVPASVDAHTFTDHAGFLGIRNRNETAVLGAAAVYVDPIESLAYFQGTIVSDIDREHPLQNEDFPTVELHDLMQPAFDMGGTLSNARCLYD